MTTPVVAVCTPIARELHPDFAISLMRWIGTLPADAPRPRFIELRGHPVGTARNKIADQACAMEDVTHLLWIDDDMAFEPDAIPRLLAHDLPIVGGLCHGRRHPYPPILLYSPPGDLGAGGSYRYRYDYPEGLVEVDATGSAFLLVRKEVYEKIDAELREAPYAERGQGEDTSFCARAKQVGYSIWIDTSIKITHMNGTIGIDEKFARRNREAEINAWYPVEAKGTGGKPVASIIIPTWNQRPEWLREAVKSALAQTVPCEVIVVDDGSDPELCPARVLSDEFLAEGTDRTIIETPHAGCFAALNAGIEVMSTDWFTWLSSDDTFHPAKVERQLQKTIAAGALASFHGYVNVGEDGTQRPIIPMAWRGILEQRMILSQACPINGLTVMLHRTVLDAVRLPDGSIFDRENYPIVADWEAWNRIGWQFSWLALPDLLATRRDFGNASTRYQADPEKTKQWLVEDQRVREKHALRCPDCDREIGIGRKS